MKIRTRNLPANAILYPFNDSEFDVQAELWSRIRQEGFEVRGEVKAVCMDDDRRRKAFLDLVVFNRVTLKPLAIIECKNSPNNHQEIGGRQKRKYSKFNLPLLLCANRSQIDPTLRNLLTILHC